MSTCYIGCPIDTARPECPPSEQFREITERVLRILPGTVFFNPFEAFANAQQAETGTDRFFVMQVNYEALRLADFAVFVWNGSPSYGVPLEIDFCRQHAKPWLVWNRSGRELGLYLKYHASVSRGLIAVDADLNAQLTQLSVTAQK